MTNQELFHAYSSQPPSVSSVDPIKKIFVCDPVSLSSKLSDRLSPYNQSSSNNNNNNSSTNNNSSSSSSSKHQHQQHSVEHHSSDTTIPESSKGNGNKIHLILS